MHLPRLPALIGAVTLTLTILACAFIETSPRPVSDSIAITRLSTLTRTPLPTLSPTTISPAEAVVMIPESLVTAPEPLTESVAIVPASIPSLDSPAVSTPIDTVSGSPDTSTTTLPAAPANALSTTSPISASVGIPIMTTTVPLATTPTVAPATATLPSTPTAPPPPTLVSTSTATATATLAGTPTATPTVTPTTSPSGWAFASLRAKPDQDVDGLLLYGDLINNTGASQELAFVTGTFYDAQGQVIAGADSTFAYWPIEMIPPGGRVPFELIVDGIQSAADFDLSVEAEPSSETPRQDFEFSNVNQWTEEDNYCVEAILRNLGGELQSYLVMALILYDGQDNIVNFNDYAADDPSQVVNDQTLTVEICVNPLNQEVARYELRAWGQ